MGKFAVVEKKFEYKGHECICIFNYMGFRCGYVSVRNAKHYYDYDIDCHGGLTFSDSLTEEYEPKHAFYIGFDCGHFCDGQDKEQAYKYGLLTKEEYRLFNIMPSYGGGVRTLEYVEEQCKSIVEQLENQGEL